MTSSPVVGAPMPLYSKAFGHQGQLKEFEFEWRFYVLSVSQVIFFGGGGGHTGYKGYTIRRSFFLMSRLQGHEKKSNTKFH